MLRGACRRCAGEGCQCARRPGGDRQMPVVWRGRGRGARRHVRQAGRAGAHRGGQDRHGQAEPDRQSGAAVSGPRAGLHALYPSETRGRGGAFDGPGGSAAHPLRGERLGHRRSARGVPAGRRLERAHPGRRRSAGGVREHQQPGEGKALRALQGAWRRLSIPRLRPQRSLSRNRRLRQHGQAEEPRDMRGHALAEELLRQHAGDRSTATMPAATSPTRSPAKGA